MAVKTTVKRRSTKKSVSDLEGAETEASVSADTDIYFLKTEKDIHFIKSGCSLLDLVLGGGWAGGRVINLVGDRSSGKTLAAIEACANFASTFTESEGRIWYNEAESAFDENYAATLGMPIDRISFVCGEEPKEVAVPDGNHTVEGLYEHLEKVIVYHENNNISKGLYVIDSLDAFSDRSELEREIDAGSYGGNKPKKLSELFRRLVRRLEKVGITLFVISQVRDKIGVTFGETKTRSGGKALDFYASQIVWLAEIGKNKKTISGIERPVSVNVRAKCKKNKVGLPFRECDYVLEFGYGIDDLVTNTEFLLKIKDDDFLASLDLKKTDYKRKILSIKKLPDAEFCDIRNKLASRVAERWIDIEKGFMPTRSKY